MIRVVSLPLGRRRGGHAIPLGEGRATAEWHRRNAVFRLKTHLLAGTKRASHFHHLWRPRVFDADRASERCRCAIDRRRQARVTSIPASAYVFAASSETGASVTRPATIHSGAPTNGADVPSLSLAPAPT